MATQPQVTGGGQQRQLLLVAALAALLLIVGLLVVRPLLGGGAEDQAVVAPPPVTAASAAPTTMPRVASPSTSVAGEGAAGSVKDPFRPLVSSGATAATAQSGLTPAGTTAAPQSTVPGAAAGTASIPGGGATADRKVTLVGVAGGKARVTVDGRVYTVAEGQRFASRYRAVDIGSECATFESGTTPFTLCQGEAVLK
jgi:hypothetical protein